MSGETRRAVIRPVNRCVLSTSREEVLTDKVLEADRDEAAETAAGEPIPQLNGTVQSGDAAKPMLDADALAKLAAVRTRIQSSVGQIVLAMMNLPRYRHQTLGDIMHLVLDPLMRDRIALATAKAEGREDETLAGIAIWATVSDAIDAKISEQVRGGAFPIRLQNEDWTSGETMWLLDVIAPNRKLATAVLANFKQVAKDKPVKIHPIVARSVDPEVLEKMRAKPAE